MLEKVKENKIAITIFQITLFLFCLPFLTIIIRSIFSIGQLIGNITRCMIG